MSTTAERNIRQGRNVKRFREMLGLKQEALALELGGDWNQKRVSLLEAKELIEPEILSEVAKALKVPEEAIKNFDEDKAIHNIQNNYDNSNVHAGPTINYNCTFNPIDKLIEVYEENKKLYEQLLASEREKIELLKKANNL